MTERKRSPRSGRSVPQQEAGSGRGGTRDRLLRATLASLARQGLAGTTSRGIAAEAGVNLQAITYHFGSKDDLVAEVLVETVREWLAPARAVLESEGDPIALMIAAVQELQAAFTRARPLLAVYVEAMAGARRNERLHRRIRRLFTELRSFLAARIGQLQGTGFLPAWIDPDAMAALLIATGDGLALHAHLDPRGIDHHAVAAQAMQLLLAAQSGPGATPP
ncbi:MAG: TetR/AcrR family transcriptional regulator [Actinomycetota bacterium]